MQEQYRNVTVNIWSFIIVTLNYYCIQIKENNHIDNIKIFFLIKYLKPVTLRDLKPFSFVKAFLSFGKRNKMLNLGYVYHNRLMFKQIEA